MKWQKDNPSLLQAIRRPPGKGAGVGGERELHEVPTGRPREPGQEKEEEEEEVVQRALLVTRSRSTIRNRHSHNHTHLFLYICED